MFYTGFKAALKNMTRNRIVKYSLLPVILIILSNVTAGIGVGGANGLEYKSYLELMYAAHSELITFPIPLFIVISIAVSIKNDDDFQFSDIEKCTAERSYIRYLSKIVVYLLIGYAVTIAAVLLYILMFVLINGGIANFSFVEFVTGISRNFLLYSLPAVTFYASFTVFLTYWLKNTFKAVAVFAFYMLIGQTIFAFIYNYTSSKISAVLLIYIYPFFFPKIYQYLYYYNTPFSKDVIRHDAWFDAAYTCEHMVALTLGLLLVRSLIYIIISYDIFTKKET